MTQLVTAAFVRQHLIFIMSMMIIRYLVQTWASVHTITIFCRPMPYLLYSSSVLCFTVAEVLLLFVLMMYMCSLMFSPVLVFRRMVGSLTSPPILKQGSCRWHCRRYFDLFVAFCFWSWWFVVFEHASAHAVQSEHGDAYNFVHFHATQRVISWNVYIIDPLQRSELYCRTMFFVYPLHDSQAKPEYNSGTVCDV